MRLLPAAPALAFLSLPAIAAAPLPFGGLPVDYGYVALTDMALAAPVVIAADIVSALPVKGTAAAGVTPGETRFFVQAATRGLVSGQAELPAQVSYLVDLPNDARGKPLKLKNVPVLLLAGVPSATGELRLIGPHAQVPRTPENDARLRAILRAKVSADAPPAITGISRAFHVPGSLPGESETQIFLRTQDARPISLNILRRPGEAPRWAVALTEMVDNSAAPPARDTLLWYRLACGLPAALPDAAVTDLGEGDAAAAREDYQVVLQGLGPCRHDGRS
jgi:hypothetical protein